MQIRVKDEPSDSYEVKDVDFYMGEIGFYTEEGYSLLSYEDVELVEKGGAE